MSDIIHSWVLLGCYRDDIGGVIRVLHGNYRGVTEVIPGCYRGCYGGCYKGCYRHVTGVQQGCYSGVTGMLLSWHFPSTFLYFPGTLLVLSNTFLLLPWYFLILSYYFPGTFLLPFCHFPSTLLVYSW